jgi:hypothetical protein
MNKFIAKEHEVGEEWKGKGLLWKIIEVKQYSSTK